jgi:hypothetical protein
MFRFLKVVVVLVLMIVAGAFLYDKYRTMCCECDCDEDARD